MSKEVSAAEREIQLSVQAALLELTALSVSLRKLQIVPDDLFTVRRGDKNFWVAYHLKAVTVLLDEAYDEILKLYGNADGEIPEEDQS